MSASTKALHVDATTGELVNGAAFVAANAALLGSLPPVQLVGGQLVADTQLNLIAGEEQVFVPMPFAGDVVAVSIVFPKNPGGSAPALHISIGTFIDPWGGTTPDAAFITESTLGVAAGGLNGRLNAADFDAEEPYAIARGKYIWVKVKTGEGTGWYDPWVWLHVQPSASLA